LIPGNTGLTGSIPSEIGLLTSLTSIIFGGRWLAKKVVLTAAIASFVIILLKLTWKAYHFRRLLSNHIILPAIGNLSGSIPSEIWSMTRLVELNFGKLLDYKHVPAAAFACFNIVSVAETSLEYSPFSSSPVHACHRYQEVIS
jgi:hypothetical protein